MCTICSTFRPYATGCDYATLNPNQSSGTTTGITAAATVTSTAPVGSVAQMADYLVNGYWTDTGASAHAFDTTPGNQISVNLTGLTADGQQLARWALESWEAVANIDFVETTGTAQITFQDDVAGAYASYLTLGGATQSATVNIGQVWIDTYGAKIGGYALQTYIHEIGHALGLGHMGNYDGTATYGSSETFANDSWQMSVMSYFSQQQNTSTDATWAEATTAMLVDVEAIQAIYGAPGATSLTAGNTVYGQGHTLGSSWMGQMFDALNGAGSSATYEAGAPAMTLYDAGGTDLVDFSSDSSNQRVDLRAGSFSDVYGATGNMAIALGTVIENYTAGAGHDRVTGNAANNVIRGGGGNDVLNGGLGHDTLDGGAGDDMLNGGDGNVGSRTRLDGGDTFIGGTGSDTVTYESAAGKLKVDLMDASFNTGAAAGDTFAGIENLIGSKGRDVLRGDAGGNRIDGGGNADILLGRGGNDTLIGGGGNDRLLGGTGGDVLDGGTGRDRAQYSQADSGVLADLGYAHLNTGEAAGDRYVSVEDLFGSRHDDDLRGTNGDNKILGAGGHDKLYGRDGNDTLLGGGGKDMFFGGAGNDTMRGGKGVDTFVFDSGQDVISDFSRDQLRLDDVLWSGNLSKAAVLGFASVDGTDTVFDFGGGNTLTLENYTDIAGLESVLTIF